MIHSLDGILRARILAIACGYEDADDLDTLRHDPGFKLALGKVPDGAVVRLPRGAFADVTGQPDEMLDSAVLDFRPDRAGIDVSSDQGPAGTDRQPDPGAVLRRTGPLARRGPDVQSSIRGPSYLGSAMTHHPHIHMIVPGGGLSPDGNRWVSSRPAFLLPVRVLGKLFRCLLLTRLMALYEAGRLAFYGSLAALADRRAFLRHLSPVRKKNWVVYAKPPFAGPQAVLAYLSRYTHRVAISNSRLLHFDETGVTLRYKNYRNDVVDRQQVMTLAADEFIRRFLLHVLPKGFHRIRHYGLLAGATRKAHLEHARQLLGVALPVAAAAPVEPENARPPCPCCGGRMLVIETFERWRQPRTPPHGTDPPGTTAS